jgi:hypothetical protein
VVGRQGLEPWTNGLKVRCSTTELPTRLSRGRKIPGEGLCARGICLGITADQPWIPSVAVLKGTESQVFWRKIELLGGLKSGGRKVIDRIEFWLFLFPWVDRYGVPSRLVRRIRGRLGLGFIFDGAFIPAPIPPPPMPFQDEAAVRIQVQRLAFCLGTDRVLETCLNAVSRFGV